MADVAKTSRLQQPGDLVRLPRPATTHRHQVNAEIRTDGIRRFVIGHGFGDQEGAARWQRGMNGPQDLQGSPVIVVVQYPDQAGDVRPLREWIGAKISACRFSPDSKARLGESIRRARRDRGQIEKQQSQFGRAGSDSDEKIAFTPANVQNAPVSGEGISIDYVVREHRLRDRHQGAVSSNVGT